MRQHPEPRPRGAPRVIAPLRFAALTPLYDATVALLTRERRWRRRLARMAAPRHGERVLDLGCGTGTLLQAFEHAGTGARLTGLDADPGALAIARRKVPRAVALVEGTAQAMPFAAASFDVVTCSLFFHHLRSADKRRVLARTREVLAPGGRLLIADWGKPTGALTRAAFLPVQWLDGFETTRDSVSGALPALIEEAGFDAAEEAPLVTPLGVIRFWRCVPRSDR